MMLTSAKLNSSTKNYLMNLLDTTTFIDHTKNPPIKKLSLSRAFKYNFSPQGEGILKGLISKSPNAGGGGLPSGVNSSN